LSFFSEKSLERKARPAGERPKKGGQAQIIAILTPKKAKL